MSFVPNPSYKFYPIKQISQHLGRLLAADAFQADLVGSQQKDVPQKTEEAIADRNNINAIPDCPHDLRLGPSV